MTELVLYWLDLEIRLTCEQTLKQVQGDYLGFEQTLKQVQSDDTPGFKQTLKQVQSDVS